MKTEKIVTPFNGYIAVVIILAISTFMVFELTSSHNLFWLALLPIVILLTIGMVVVSPNTSKVLLLFGAYQGSVKQNGLFWINPFYSRTSLSLRARNLESEKIKVNDKMGNPILISVILVWRVCDTF